MVKSHEIRHENQGAAPAATVCRRWRVAGRGATGAGTARSRGAADAAAGISAGGDGSNGSWLPYEFPMVLG